MKGNSITIDVKSSNTIKRAKNQLKKFTEGIPQIDWNLYLDGIELEEFKTFAEYSISDNSTLRIGFHLKKGAHFLVRDLTGRSNRVEIGKFDTLDHVKEKIRELKGYPPDQQRLIFGDVELKDGVVVDQMDIIQTKLLRIGRINYFSTHPTIMIVLRLRGGGNIVHHQPGWNLSNPSPNDHGANDEEEFIIDGSKDQNANGENGATVQFRPKYDDAIRISGNEIYHQSKWEDGSTVDEASSNGNANETTRNEPTFIPYSVKLNGTNYTIWSQVVSMFIAGRGMMGYLTGTIREPATHDATYEKWVMENAIVKGWLIGAMEPNVMNLFICLPTAKRVWKTVLLTYYEGANRSVVYNLSRKAMETKQAGRPIASYYSGLTGIWQELDHHKPITFTQAEVILARKKEIDEERVYLFLAGLDDIYDVIRGEILRTEPFPTPEMAFVIVRREEQRRHTMLC